MRLANGAAGKRFQQDDQRPDLQEVLEYYGIAAPHSGMYECPFHDEVHPSLSVDLDKQLYNCFACGARGDSWTAIMVKEETDFAGAREFAATADFAGVASEAGGREVPEIFGRKRPRVPRSKGDSRNSRWKRPW